MSGIDFINIMERTLVPQGTLPLVRLFLKDSSYFSEEFIKSCIQEIERLPMNMALGEKITPLQKLGMYVLLDSAYIERGDTSNG